MRIAIVDDEASLRKLATHTLTEYSQKNGIEIETSDFESGEEFLKAYEPGMFDLIFMDVYMSGIDGIETVQTLRKKDINAIVVFLTASEEHMRYAFNCHAFDYVVKPATRPEIFRVMDEVIRMLGDELAEETKFVEFSANHMNIKIPQDKLVSCSVQGHTLYVCDDKRNIYTTKLGFAAFQEMVNDWENILVINRSVLVNMDYIDRFEGSEVYMKDGWRFFAKVRSCKELRQAWTEYKISKE